MHGDLDQGLDVAGDPVALGQRRIDASEPLTCGLVAIKTEGLVDGLPGRDNGRPSAGDLLEIGGLRGGEFGGQLTSGRSQMPYGLLQGIVEELI